MSFPIYDFRKDHKNLIVTPELRSRFLYMPSGVKTDLKNKASGHSHDLGYEITDKDGQEFEKRLREWVIEILQRQMEKHAAEDRNNNT